LHLQPAEVRNSLIDALVTFARFVVGVPVIAVLAILILVLIWPLEFFLGFFTLLIAALVMSRKDIKDSWLGDWPRNSPEAVSEISSKVWDWIFDDWYEDD
jgi:hypothetical protein